MLRNKIQLISLISFILLGLPGLMLGQAVTTNETVSQSNTTASKLFIYDSKGKRNPFSPLVTPDGRIITIESEENNSGLLLEGIIYDKSGQSCAMVNSEIVKVGDSIGDYQVLKIEEDRVIFIKEGEAFEQRIKKEE